MSVIKVNTIQNANGTTGITFAANGQMTLANTPLQLTGGQIAFPATQIASADANTLDDYEEGTWTPVLTAQTGSITSYTVANGTYIKIGNTVSVIAYVTITNAGTASSTLLLTLPFTPTNENWSGFGAEIAAVGFALSVFGTGSSLGFRKYENSTAAGTSNGFKIGAVYRTS